MREKMMKIAVISFSNKKYMPYLFFYRKILDATKVEYDFYTWNRYNEEFQREKNEVCFEKKCSTYIALKAFYFIKWRRWIISHLTKNRYDKIIVLTTIPAILLSNFLIREYRDNYIFDIRDYTYEKLSFYKRCVTKLINYSYMTCISSAGFYRFLDNHPKIHIVHNLSDIGKYDMVSSLDFEKVNIGYLGTLGYIKYNKSLIHQLRNKDDVCLYYMGSYIGKHNNIEDYAKENNCKNVYFGSAFNNSEKSKLYYDLQINMINAVYGNDSLLVSSALPNKLYDCLQLKIPILVSKGTYLGEIVEKYGLGIAIDVNDNIYEKIRNYADGFDEKQFIDSVDKYLSIVIKEHQNTVIQIKQFLMTGKE